MDDQRTADRATIGSPTTKRTSGGSGAPSALGQGGPSGNPTGPRDANDPGSTRYGKSRGTGANEPKHNETKEDGGWVSRQGGDQSKGPGTEPDHDAREDER
jgi:hypothetical protein